MISIRKATVLDSDTVRELHLRAFPAGEAEMVARLGVNLLQEQTDPATISLIAEINGVIAGHIAFSPLTVEAGMDWKAYILAPLGVLPRFQRCRVGSELIENSLERLSEKGVNIVFVYGDPAYYGKFGFKAETASNYSPPYGLKYPFGWQAVSLAKESPAEQATKISCVGSLCDPALW